MKSRFLWENQDKWVLKTDLGYTIAITMELKKRADKPRPEFPENFKFKIMARSLENPSELVRLDNHSGKTRIIMLTISKLILLGFLGKKRRNYFTN